MPGTPVADEVRFQSAFAQSAIAASITKPDGRWLFVNRALADLLGYSEEALLGRAFQSLTHPDDLPQNLALLQRALSGEIDRYTMEKRLLHARGYTVWVLLSVALVRGDDGAPQYLVTQYEDLTERHAAEERIAASELYFRALTEQSSEIVLVFDEAGRVEYTNPACLRLLGYPQEEVIGKSVFDFVAPEGRATAAARLATLVAGESVTAETEVVHRDGSRRTLSGLARNLLDDPVVHGIVLNAHDITERRRTENALRETEARFAHIATNVPGMVYQYVLRPNGKNNYTFVSEGARRLFGVAPEAAMRDPSVLLDMIHPDDRDRFLRLAREVEQTLGPFRWEGRVVLPSGAERFVQIAAHNQRGDGVVLSDGIVTDLTEVRDAARRLDESEQRYRSLFAHNPDAVFSLDTAGKFLSANPACYALAGYAEGELLGAPFEPLVFPEDLGTAFKNFGIAVSGKATQYEVGFRHRSGKRVQIGITNVPMIVGGRVIGVFGIAKDLTVQRELEQQLRQSQKMEAVGRLAGGVAHDFNNLLTVIISYTQMALASLPRDASVRADLREVESSAGRAAELTRQLLAFSRQQVLRPQRLDVNRVVTESVAMLRRLIGEDVTLQTELAPGLWPVHSDPGQLAQVLMNLAVNARDAMTGGGTLSLRTQNVIVDKVDARTRPGLVAGAYAGIIVQDTGTGIDPSVLPNIFEPFYTTKGPGHGTGLGLATVYGIVKQSDGFIYAESTPGAGSRFTVLLPRTDRDGFDDAQSMAAAPPRGHETILLVEDAASVRGAVRRMLESLGYTVLEAASAPEALQIAARAHAQKAPIHLVLTDVVMPEISGRALREQLARQWPELKVLYMSGYTNDEILRRGIGDASEMLLEKPFTLERLAAAARHAIDATSGHPRT